MKSIVKILLVISLIAFSLNNRTRSKSRKEGNMFELMNTLSSSNSNKEKSQNQNTEFTKLKSKFKKNKRSHSRTQNKKSHSILDNLSNNEEKNKKNNHEINMMSLSETTKYLYSGWQMIRSKLFTNEIIFPKVKVVTELGNIKEEGIPIDREYYRINKKKNPEPRTNKEFFFRMTDDLLAYTVDGTDVNYLQVFYLKNFYKVEELPIKFLKDRTSISCFDLIERKTKFRYTFCNKDRKENLTLMCKIGHKFKLVLDSCIKEDGNPGGVVPPTIVKKEVIDATIVIPLPSKNCNEKWTYENHGDDWECECKQGDSQSPIDLPSVDETIQSPIAPLFQFEEVPAKSPVTTVEGEYIEDGNIKIKYLNGAIRVLHPNLGKAITCNGNQYIAEEINVHTPSEHTKEGRRFDMEIQFVFYGVSKGDIAKQVVLSFLFEKKAGYYNRFIDDLDFYTLPNPVETEKFILNDLFIPKIFYSVSGDTNTENEFVTMKPFSFYTYEGSLTQPPCSESTIHYVASEPLPIGSVVLDLAMEALRMPDMKRDDSLGQSTVVRDTSFIENYRNVQHINHRQVFYYDHKKYQSPSLELPSSGNNGKESHYERVHRNVFYHIFVPGSHPSGIPGSFLESKDDAYGIKKDQKK